MRAACTALALVLAAAGAAATVVTNDAGSMEWSTAASYTPMMGHKGDVIEFRYNAYHDVHQLWDVYMQKHYRQKFFDSIAKRLARATVNKALKTGRKASVAGLNMRETDARTATQKLQASIIGESTQELEKHSRQEATMAYEMGVQDLRQPLCISKYMCDTYVCVCVYIYRQTDRQTDTHTHTQVCGTSAASVAMWLPS